MVKLSEYIKLMQDIQPLELTSNYLVSEHNKLCMVAYFCLLHVRYIIIIMFACDLFMSTYISCILIIMNYMLT